mmetsp:Transcript_537/g.1268  ORF Transcript_537/g.1268 Transcript_537/m.1268 type:complete len:209 (-) Transcript_537:704-1330(-)
MMPREQEEQPCAGQPSPAHRNHSFQMVVVVAAVAQRHTHSVAMVFHPKTAKGGSAQSEPAAVADEGTRGNIDSLPIQGEEARPWTNVRLVATPTKSKYVYAFRERFDKSHTAHRTTPPMYPRWARPPTNRRTPTPSDPLLPKKQPILIFQVCICLLHGHMKKNGSSQEHHTLVVQQLDMSLTAQSYWRMKLPQGNERQPNVVQVGNQS